jgi:hypothetical protein
MDKPLTRADRSTWIETIWPALWAYREDCIPEGDESYDTQWDEICTAMAWITEEIEGEDNATQ